MKGVWAVPIIASILILGFIGYGSIVFGDDDDDIRSLLCPVGQAMTGILFEDDDEILDVICDTGATGPAGITPIFIKGTTSGNTILTWAGHDTTFGPSGIPLESLLIPSSGTISNLFVELDPQFGPPGLGESITVTILLNGDITSVSCTVVDENFDCSNTVDGFDVMPGDSIILEISRSGSATITNVNASFTFTSG